MDKAELRLQSERLRAGLILRGDEGGRVATHFKTIFDQLNINVDQMIVALYMPIRHELDPIPLMDWVRSNGGVAALPVMRTETKTLDFVAYDGHPTLTPGPYGITQPTGASVIPDIIVVPMLAFDHRGGRLGYGGGYYDRTLAKLRGNGHKLWAVGYAYAEQMSAVPLPMDATDIRMDFVVTPQQVHDCRAWKENIN